MLVIRIVRIARMGFLNDIRFNLLLVLILAQLSKNTER